MRAGDAIVAIYVQPAPRSGWLDFAERLRVDVSDVRYQVAARPLLERELENVLERELVVFFSLALLSNAALIFLSFRSLALTVAILAPVTLAVVTVFAVMFVTGTALDPVNLVVIPLIFGIGVDDGVYVTARAREVHDIGAAIRLAGRALVMTSLTTAAGFGFLGISEYPPLATMGRLATLGLLLCLLLSVTLLPALLKLLSPRGGFGTVVESVG
jgi:predicted RND superfamily exporter protein